MRTLLTIAASVMVLALAAGCTRSAEGADEAKPAAAKADEAKPAKADEAKPAEMKAAPKPAKAEEAKPAEPKAAPKTAKAEEAKPAAAPTAEVATFAVPELDDTLVKGLTTALARHDGVVSAKADREAGAFRVTFRPGATNPPKLLAALTAVAPKATLKGVSAAGGDAAAPAVQSKCGGCPHRKTCGGH